MAAFSTDHNEMITSFSNPNYTMMDADALNSNLPPSSTTYYSSEDNAHIYDAVSSPIPPSRSTDNIQNSDTKSRKKYANIDLTSMGIELPGEQNPSMTKPMKHSNSSVINTPDSMTSMDSDGRDSAYSAGPTSPAGMIITSPFEKTGRILEVEHNEDNDTEDEDVSYPSEWKPKGFLGYYASLEQKKGSGSEEEEKEEDRRGGGNAKAQTNNGNEGNKSYDSKTKVINSPDSNDSGIQADVQHINGPLNDDIYAVVQKPKQDGKKLQESPIKEEAEEEDGLPPGWEKHEDEDGPYYWHIKSGTIQREPPPPPPPERHLSSSSDSERARTDSSSSENNGYTRHSDPHLQEFEGHAFKYAAESLKSLSKSIAKDSREKERRSRSKDSGDVPIRFAVRSLGWVRIDEEDLTPEKSSKAVNKCIVDLSLGRNDINDVVGRWGDGKDLLMDLDEQSLILIDPQDMSVLNVQPIQSIRVWGVGRDNGRERDFAYVARDRITRKHMCHVFRCDTPARQIANTLRDICQKIMLERSKSLAVSGDSGHRAIGITRPNNLPVAPHPEGQKITFESLINNTSFPTPMEEPKKVIRCHYLGTAQVGLPTGIEVLNSAADKVYNRVPPEKWVFVSVAVAPSTITITENAKPDNIMAECRVRFLSFMGISQINVKLCSFIMHTAQDQFVAHVFHCEPSAGALCKTIEAACKLRYQKCLDSHHNQIAELKKQASQQQSKGLGASLKQGMQSVFAGLGKSRKSKS